MQAIDLGENQPVRMRNMILSTLGQASVDRMKILVRKIIVTSSPDGIGRRHTKPLLLPLIAIILLHFSLISGSAKIVSKKVPFLPGEKLTYQGAWGILPAGEVTLEVLPKETVDGVDAYHFAKTTKTNRAVDLIYKVRERQDSYVDAGLARSLLYKKRTVSKHPRDIVVRFDWEKKEVHYTNFGEKAPPLPVPPGSFDPLAIFFILRLHDLKENSVIEVPVTDGRMNLQVKATIGKKETIEIQGKMFDALEVWPDMERLEELVKKSDNPQMKIWFSADEKKLPLKIQSQVGIITFDFELVSMTP